jgi:hypothetical protein
MSTISADPVVVAAEPSARFAALRGRVPVPWVLVTALAVTMALADMFWLTSLQGAVGAIERSQGPFAGWARDSALVVPVFFAAVLWVFVRAHRKHGSARRRLRTTVATALLVVAVGTGVGVAATVASAAYDFHLQSQLLERTASLHGHGIGGAGGTVANPAYADSGWTPEQRQTMALDVKAAAFGSGIILATNLLLVSWVIALAGGRVDARAARGRPAP